METILALHCSRSDRAAGIRAWQWIAIIAVFLMAGIIGHDPWKQSETYSFGIIYNFYTTGTWLVPMNGGVPFLEKPPLYYWTAKIFCHVFGGILPLHDAARLTSVFYMLISVIFVWKTSQLLFAQDKEREAMGWMTLALFLGSVGKVFHAHEMATDTALLAGSAMAFYGVARLVCQPESWRMAGLWMGFGTGIAFMSKGFFMPVVLAIAGALLVAFLPALRTRRTLLALLIALIAALPFLTIWPTLLYLNSPDLFREWFWQNNIGRFLGFSVDRLGAPNDPLYFLSHLLPFFLFPAFPLACLAIIMGACRGDWRHTSRIVPLALCVSGLCILLASATARAVYLLPLSPAFALLGAQGLQYLPGRFLAIWNGLVRIIISSAALAIWVLWLSLLYQTNTVFAPIAQWAGVWFPLHYVPAGTQLGACMAALLVAVFWLTSFQLNTRLALNTAYIWLAAMTLLWGTAFTLLLPWVNETKSYRGVLAEMQSAVSHSAYKDDCIANGGLGESVAPMLQYFSGRLAPLQNPNEKTCPLLLLLTRRNDPLVIDPRWELLWRGSRPLDEKNEELRLYHRLPQVIQ